jgi:hypothetical protein
MFFISILALFANKIRDKPLGNVVGVFHNVGGLALACTLNYPTNACPIACFLGVVFQQVPQKQCGHPSKWMAASLGN